jgi:glycosyltransferase involved in cell wall biosynthesis
MNYLDPERFQLTTQTVSDSDDDFPFRQGLIRRTLRGLVQISGMEWYKLSDLVAEFKALQRSYGTTIDVIHYLDGEHSAQFLPLLFSLRRRSGRPIVVATYHQPPNLLPSLVNKRVVASLDCITVVSPDQVSYFRKFMEPRRIRVILHGVNIDYFAPAGSPRRDGKFRCLTVGQWLRDYKVVRGVAERLQNYKQIEFHIVSSQADNLRDLPNVIVHMGIDDARLLDLYQRSDLLFLPLLQCTANNVLLEGIACGLPILSSKLVSTEAYLSGFESILIPGNDADQFVAAILYLLHSPGARKKMGLAARRRAMQLDWRNIIPQYEQLYSELNRHKH